MRLVGSTFLLLLFSGLFTGSQAIASMPLEIGGTAADIAIQDRNSITGFVFGEARTPLSRINVELQTEFYTTIGRTLTNGAGIYTFHGLPAGRYYVKVLTVGTNYQEQTQSVSLVPVSAVEGRGTISEQMDFYLKVNKKEGETPFAASVVVAQDVPESAKRSYEEGLKLLGEKRNQESWEKFKAALEIFPDYYYALEKLGNEYVRNGHWEAAAILLRNAVRVYDKDFASRFGLGIAEFRMGNHKLATEEFQKAVEIERNSINANMWLGISLHAEKKFNDALASLLKAKKLDGGAEAAEVHWQLARIYKDMNRFTDAADSLELYLKYRPDAENAEEVKKIVITLRAKK